MAISHDPNQSTKKDDDVLITGELAHRSCRTPDYAAENRALAALAQELATNPGGVLQRCAELVTELCRADSAGISLLEPGSESGLFRWHGAAGGLAPHLGRLMEQDVSPYGTAIARDGVLLFDRPLAKEGRLGLWRWFLGAWGIGTYRKHDSVDVAYEFEGRRYVAEALDIEPPDAAPSQR